MAACGSLQHIFESPLPAENPTLLESLTSWNQLKPVKPIENSSFTEIFGELHFKESSPLLSPSSSSSSSLSSSSSPPISSSSSSLGDFDTQPKIDDQECNGTNIENQDGEEKQLMMMMVKSPSSKEYSYPSTPKTNYNRCHKSSDSFSSMNSESLQLCTEGLGFESSDDVEDLKIPDMNEDFTSQEEKVSFTKPYNCCGGDQFRRPSRSSSGNIWGFPPPISCISKSGKPWVCFKSYRHDGRFVLKEIRIPTQEFLHAYRENGRLKLHFILPDDEILGEEDDLLDDEEEDEEENEEENEDDEEDDDDEKNGAENADAEAAINEGNEAKTVTSSTDEV